MGLEHEDELAGRAVQLDNVFLQGVIARGDEIIMTGDSRALAIDAALPRPALIATTLAVVLVLLRVDAAAIAAAFIR